MIAARKSSSARPDRRKLILYATIAAVVLGVIVAVGFASRVPKAASDAPIAASKLKVGDPAPNFAVKTNLGDFELANVSTPVLLEIFATWCPHCQRETVALNAVTQKYAGKLAVVAVSGSPYAGDGKSAASQDDVTAFGDQLKVRYPLAFDPDLKVAQQYIKAGFPTLVLIDKNKKVRWITDGETPEADIVKAVDATL